MKVIDARAKTEDELTGELDVLGKEIFNLRFQRANGQLENTARVRQVRRDIARIKTLLGERRGATLETVKLPDGSGVSAGTVTYFIGLCQEALGRNADAQAAFTKAAASPEARVSQDGPLIAPLAQRKLQRR